jgi:Flp pilus assembly protein TadD
MAHRAADASRERARIADILRRVNTDPGATAASLNAVAWTAASAGVALDDALKAATKAAVLEPKNTDILDTVAEIQVKRGNFQEALRANQSALDIAPDDPDLKARKKEIEDAARRAPKKTP